MWNEVSWYEAQARIAFIFFSTDDFLHELCRRFDE